MHPQTTAVTNNGVSPGLLLAYRARILNFLIMSTRTRQHFEVVNEQLSMPTVFIVSQCFAYIGRHIGSVKLH